MKIGDSLGLRCAWALAAWLLLAGLLRAEEESGGFLRFVETGPHEGHVDTAISGYLMPDGQQVDLIAVIHVGDRAYYQDLNRRFRSYDALLYEMVVPPGARPGRPGGQGRPRAVPEEDRRRMASFKLVGGIQQGMKSLLELEFQGDLIDYTAGNLVHADMDLLTLTRRQKDRGESLWTFMLQTAIEDYKLQLSGQKSAPELGDLLGIFLSSRSRAHGIKWILAKDMNHLEKILSGVGAGGGSVILNERNQIAMSVLDRELAAGRRKLGIFYGAGHMKDLEERILARGGVRQETEWLVAWELRKDPPGSP